MHVLLGVKLVLDTSGYDVGWQAVCFYETLLPGQPLVGEFTRLGRSAFVLNLRFIVFASL